MAEAYGVWVEKKNYGRTYMGINRSSFLVDEKGKLGGVLLRVQPWKYSTNEHPTLKRV